jgi:hypothetical protein
MRGMALTVRTALMTDWAGGGAEGRRCAREPRHHPL